MKKVFIKYNPYKLETTISVDENPFIQKNNTYLQEWAENLPKLLCERYSAPFFDITFYGPLADYADLKSIFAEYCLKHKTFNVLLDRIHVETVEDKIRRLDEVFQKLQDKSIDKLYTQEFTDVFKQLHNNEIQVCVVAPMSVGKSTLINALLGDKLLPSKQESCTSLVTYIKDIDSPTDSWKVHVYGRSYENVTLKDMQRLNSDNSISQITIEGNIPFISDCPMRLVLIDTPGPNNARNQYHRERQQELLSHLSHSLIMYVMDSTFGTTDDDELLRSIIKERSSHNCLRDKFIFVINKMDARKQEDGPMEKTLVDIRTYLESLGIVNPLLFPVSALAALNIRLVQAQKADKELSEDTRWMVQKLNKRFYTQCERLAPLSSSSANKMIAYLKDSKDIYTEALIHSGILALEEALKQYVEQYANIVKIRTTVEILKELFQKMLKIELRNAKKEDGFKEKIMSPIEVSRDSIKKIEDELESVLNI